MTSKGAEPFPPLGWRVKEKDSLPGLCGPVTGGEDYLGQELVLSKGKGSPSRDRAGGINAMISISSIGPISKKPEGKGAGWHIP